MIIGEQIITINVVNNCSKYIHGRSYLSDHDIPKAYKTMKYLLGIGLQKGILCVLSHYNTGLFLFNTVSSNSWNATISYVSK